MSHGVTRWIFFQWTASMSTIRSLSTGMLPIGSISITPSRERGLRLVEVRVAGEAGSPLTRTPHEPQIASRHEQRMPIEPSKRVFGLQDRPRARSGAARARRVLVPVGRLARLRVVAAERSVNSWGGAVVVLGHQYFRSSGCHWVIVTGE